MKHLDIKHLILIALCAFLLLQPPPPAHSSYLDDSLMVLKNTNPTAAPGVANVPIVGMVFSYEANSVYQMWGNATINNNAATTGVGFNWDTSTAVTVINSTFYHQLANTGTLTGGSQIADAVSVGVSSGVPTLNVACPVSLQGHLVTGASSGTATLNFRSEVAVAANCTSVTMVVRKL